MITLTDKRVLTVQDMAADTIEHMNQQLAVCANYWGYTKPAEVLRMALTLSAQLSRLFHTGFGRELSVNSNGDLSLYCVSGIHFGMIFFPNDRPDEPQPGDARIAITAPREGRYCIGYATGEATTLCHKPYLKGERSCTDHDPVPAALPVLGEWSFHS